MSEPRTPPGEPIIGQSPRHKTDRLTTVSVPGPVPVIKSKRLLAAERAAAPDAVKEGDHEREGSVIGSP
jgi:hypothetical protein